MKENEIKKKRSVIRVICRRCCAGGKCSRIHDRLLVKKAWHAKKPTQRNPVTGQKDHFTQMTRQEKIKEEIKNYKHTHKKTNKQINGKHKM